MVEVDRKVTTFKRRRNGKLYTGAGIAGAGAMLTRALRFRKSVALGAGRRVGPD